MIFNKHDRLVGLHSFLSPSKYHWINYSDEKMAEVYKKALAVERGTQLHAFACDCIRLGQKLPKSAKTLNLYVNDAIGFRMTPEQPLYYSDNAFGTADAIAYRDGFLRIHDLKTGESATSHHQLEVYAALFFLEYGIVPGETQMELRIYQNNEILIENPGADEIVPIMDKIVTFNKIIEKLKREN